MKHFGVYRKLILIAGTVIAAVSVGSVFFMENTSALMLFVICAFAILCGLLFLLDFLHNRYHDDLLEQITLLIEALVEQQERIVFPENEDTLTARLQHQLLKLRNILTAQNQMLAQEKEQIKTLISDISHQIKTPVSAANTFAQLLDDKELSDEERSEYIATLQTSLEKLTFLTNSLYTRLVAECGFEGCEASVRRAVAELKDKVSNVFVPLSYDPAEAVQIDWGEATVVLGGIKQKIQIWCMRECHSGDIFVSAFYRQNEESFLEGIVKGLEHFGGTPQKIIFD